MGRFLPQSVKVTLTQMPMARGSPLVLELLAFEKMNKPGGESLESLQKNFSINAANIIATWKCTDTCAIPA